VYHQCRDAQAAVKTIPHTIREGIMGVIHRYKGQFDWEGVSPSTYPPDKEMKGVSVRWLIGPAEEAPNFALRYFEVGPGG
jgi:hypothetical protein